jgi:hypothetical protein
MKTLAFGMAEPICGSFGTIDMQAIDLTAGIHHSPLGRLRQVRRFGVET